MKITLQSTDKIVTLETNSVNVPARIWQGEPESGIPVHAYITLIAPEIHETNPRIDELTAEFDRELKRHANPRPAVLDIIPLRMIL